MNEHDRLIVCGETFTRATLRALASREAKRRVRDVLLMTPSNDMVAVETFHPDGTAARRIVDASEAIKLLDEAAVSGVLFAVTSKVTTSVALKAAAILSLEQRTPEGAA